MYCHFLWITVYISKYAFSALMLLVGRQEGHLPCRNWVVRYRHGYLSGARCKWFAYGPADAIATPLSLAPVKSRMVYLPGAGLPRLSWKKGHLMDVVYICVWNSPLPPLFHFKSPFSGVCELAGCPLLLSSSSCSRKEPSGIFGTEFLHTRCPFYRLTNNVKALMEAWSTESTDNHPLALSLVDPLNGPLRWKICRYGDAVWLEGIKGAPGEDAGPGFPGRKGDRGEPGIPGREGKTFFYFNVQMTGVNATATLFLSVFSTICSLLHGQGGPWYEMSGCDCCILYRGKDVRNIFKRLNCLTWNISAYKSKFEYINSFLPILDLENSGFLDTFFIGLLTIGLLAVHVRRFTNT